jgi:hypothetical protein
MDFMVCLVPEVNYLNDTQERDFQYVNMRSIVFRWQYILLDLV